MPAQKIGDKWYSEELGRYFDPSKESSMGYKNVNLETPPTSFGIPMIQNPQTGAWESEGARQARIDEPKRMQDLIARARGGDGTALMELALIKEAGNLAPEYLQEASGAYQVGMGNLDKYVQQGASTAFKNMPIHGLGGGVNYDAAMSNLLRSQQLDAQNTPFNHLTGGALWDWMKRKHVGDNASDQDVARFLGGQQEDSYSFGRQGNPWMYKYIPPNLRQGYFNNMAQLQLNAAQAPYMDAVRDALRPSGLGQFISPYSGQLLGAAMPGIGGLAGNALYAFANKPKDVNFDFTPYQNRITGFQDIFSSPYTSGVNTAGYNAPQYRNYQPQSGGGGNPFQNFQPSGGGNPFANFQQPQWQQPTRPQQPANQWWLNTIGR